MPSKHKLIPEGYYTADIISAEMKRTVSGRPYLRVKRIIDKGPYAGTALWQNLFPTYNCIVVHEKVNDTTYYSVHNCNMKGPQNASKRS